MGSADRPRPWTPCARASNGSPTPPRGPDGLSVSGGRQPRLPPRATPAQEAPAPTRQDDCCVVVVQYLADIRRSMAIHARPTAERRCEDVHHLTRRRPPREPGGVISGVLVLPMWSKGARVIREMRQSSFARTKSQSLTSLPGGSGPYVAR